MDHHNMDKLSYTGTFSLSETIEMASRSSFAEAFHPVLQRSDAQQTDAVVLLDESWASVGVRLGQTNGKVCATVWGNQQEVSTSSIRTQLERILSLDVDGAGFQKLATRDVRVASLIERWQGVRPLLIPSVYEAAARAIIGHRLFVKQAAAICARLAAKYGAPLTIEGHVMNAFPSPKKLSVLSEFQGLSQRKIHQLRALGTFSDEGGLSIPKLRAMNPDSAVRYLQQLAGIGTFSADLILIRGIGDADVFPVEEKRLQSAMSLMYGLENSPAKSQLISIAESWRPYRSWVGLLLRNSEVRSRLVGKQL